jgi:hypothetical protein
MKVIIAGGRDFVPMQKHFNWLAKTIKKLCVTEIVSGGCSGADLFGECAANHYALPIKLFPANWKEYGLAAGPMRNEEMAKYADACILFPGGRGTDDMKRRAISHGLTVIDYKEEANE